jgi:pyruvate kinase
MVVFSSGRRKLTSPGPVRNEYPLRTKIVATIGNEKSYTDGIYDLNLNHHPSGQFNCEYIVREFYNSGVDVIRLNLSHIPAAAVKETFLKIKDTIRRCEGETKNQRRIAVLADLPGPKIRFRLKDYRFRVGAEFTIDFGTEKSGGKAATVYADDEPLQIALSKRTLHDRPSRPARDAFPQTIENALGREFLASGDLASDFQRMMERLGERLDQQQRVLAVIGDGDVIMEVDAEVFSADASFIKSKILTVKGSRSQAGSVERTGADVDEVVLSGNKGFTLKGVDMDIPSFTNEDRQKLDILLEAEFEGVSPDQEPVLAFVALSFAQTAHDVLRIKKHIETRLVGFGKTQKEARLQAPSVIAKIETSKGWLNRDFILDVADGVMIARGDLGLQVAIEEVPAIQKKLIGLCNKRGKPVITATEMLKSMTSSIEPTRAEGTDVFNAIMDGSDAVMMSEETSAGKFPFHSIRKMISIAVEAERYYMREPSEGSRRQAKLLQFQDFFSDDVNRVEQNTDRFGSIVAALEEGITVITDEPGTEDEIQELEWRERMYREKRKKSLKQHTTDLITQATCMMSESEGIKCIVAATTSGRTVRMISRLRPSVPIIGAAHDIINTRKLAVSYGVLPICIGEAKDDEKTEDLFNRCQNMRNENVFLSSLLRKGDSVIFTAGTRLNVPGTTNVIQMRTIGEED